MGVTVIQPRRDEATDICLKVLSCKKWLHHCQLPKVEKAGLNDCADLRV